MTTGSETHTGSDMPWQIPDDWAADLQSGHVIVVPANTHGGTLSPSGYIVYAYDEQQPAHGVDFVLDPDQLRERFSYLERNGYTYQGFRPWLRQKPTKHATVYEIATALARYKDRLVALYEAASGEDIAWNEDSAHDFQAFISDNPYWRKAGLALMDNGNLRAVWEWEQDDETHLALQFLGDKSVQYVIFKRRTGARRVSRGTGTETFDGIQQLVSAYDLTSLVH